VVGPVIGFCFVAMCCCVVKECDVGPKGMLFFSVMQRLGSQRSRENCNRKFSGSAGWDFVAGIVAGIVG
jgi:hypothetical protein